MRLSDFLDWYICVRKCSVTCHNEITLSWSFSKVCCFFSKGLKRVFVPVMVDSAGGKNTSANCCISSHGLNWFCLTIHSSHHITLELKILGMIDAISLVEAHTDLYYASQLSSLITWCSRGPMLYSQLTPLMRVLGYTLPVSYTCITCSLLLTHVGFLNIFQGILPATDVKLRCR